MNLKSGGLVLMLDKKRNTLYVRILLLCAASSVVIAILMSSFFFLMQWDQVKNQLSTKGRFISSQIAQALGGLQNGKGFQWVESTIKNSFNDADLHSVDIVMSGEHQRIHISRSISSSALKNTIQLTSPVHSKSTNKLKPSKTQDLYVGSSSITLLYTQIKNHPWPEALKVELHESNHSQNEKPSAYVDQGDISVIVNLTDQWAYGKQVELLAKGLLLVVFLLTGAVGLAWLGSRSLVKPLESIAQFLKKLSTAEYSNQLCKKMPGEIDELRNLLNKLSEILQASKQLNDRYVYDLIKTKEEAQAASKAKSEFLAVMTHELRTPMNGVLGMLQLLSQTPLNKDQQEFATLALQSGDHLLALINDILDFTKVEQGRVVLCADYFNAYETTSSLLKGFESVAFNKGLRFTSKLEDLVGYEICTDETRFRQVMTNLVGNAIKFTKSGEVSIKCDLRVSEAKDAKSELSVFVTDTGVGIAAENLSKVFEVFQQEDCSTSREFGGTGLGLSISAKLVELMGGRLEVDSVQGEGSTFYFRMAVPVRPAIKPLVVGSDVRPENDTLFQPAILLVEDNPVNQKVGIKMLERLGAIVTLAEDGDIAVELCKKESFDLIFMDLQMPNMDGYQATTLIRKLPNFTYTPIVAMTANAIQEIKETCLEVGMDDFVAKPYKKEKLFKIIKNWVFACRSEIDRKNA